MRKFRNNVSDGWLFGQVLRLWRNFARNWDKDVDDCNLAPGDFRTVRQSLYYLGGSVTNAQRIDALARESEVKKDTKRGGMIGFGAR